MLIRAKCCTHDGTSDPTCVIFSQECDWIFLVLPISKFVCENLVVSNFGISQVKFNMHLLHWIIVKIIYRKPKKWGRVDDSDLYLMWALLTESGTY